MWLHNSHILHQLNIGHWPMFDLGAAFDLPQIEATIERHGRQLRKFSTEFDVLSCSMLRRWLMRWRIPPG